MSFNKKISILIFTGLAIKDAARMFVKLMKRLGHERFYLQGGDWGAGITAEIATVYPEYILFL